jgi:hypothetical protein
MKRTWAPDKGEAPEAVGNCYKAKEFVRTTRATNLGQQIAYARSIGVVPPWTLDPPRKD